MKRYYYTTLTLTTNPGEFTTTPRIYSTHPETLEWVVEAVREFIPDCDTRRELHDNLSKELIGFELHKLDNKDVAVGEWLSLELPKRGWRPLSNMDISQRFQNGSKIMEMEIEDYPHLSE
ncbi:MAG: hypothetical protein GY805_19610 [Chloroflexi bacterium]|nr:hypothetical protein [Chloroflexota bacterium]